MKPRRLCDVEGCEQTAHNNHKQCQPHFDYLRSVVLKEAKPVITPDGEFRSVTTAARHYGVDGIIVTANIKNGVEGWAYLN